MIPAHVRSSRKRGSQRMWVPPDSSQGEAFKVVEQHFGVGECHVRIAEHLHHLEEAWFAERLESSGD